MKKSLLFYTNSTGLVLSLVLTAYLVLSIPNVVVTRGVNKQELLERVDSEQNVKILKQLYRAQVSSLFVSNVQSSRLLYLSLAIGSCNLLLFLVSTLVSRNSDENP